MRPIGTSMVLLVFLRSGMMLMFGLDHSFGHVLGRGGFHIRLEQGRYGIRPYSLDQTMIKALMLMAVLTLTLSLIKVFKATPVLGPRLKFPMN